MDWAAFFGAILGSAITASISVYLANKAIKNDIANLDKVINTRIGVEVLSKNRQKWINNLRKQIASFVSQVNSSMADIPKKYAVIKMEILKRQGKADDERYQLDSDGLKEFISFTQDIILNLNCLLINVELMLNPNEENNKKVINLMTDIYLSVSDLYCCFLPSNLQPKDFDKNLTPKKICLSINNNCKELKEIVVKILKTEWERVKKGI